MCSNVYVLLFFGGKYLCFLFIIKEINTHIYTAWDCRLYSHEKHQVKDTVMRIHKNCDRDSDSETKKNSNNNNIDININNKMKRLCIVKHFCLYYSWCSKHMSKWFLLEEKKKTDENLVSQTQKNVTAKRFYEKFCLICICLRIKEKKRKKGNIILLCGKWWYQHKPWHQIAQSFAQYCYDVVEFLFLKNTQIKKMLLLDRDRHSFIAISSSICFHFSHNIFNWKVIDYIVILNTMWTMVI